ncbi:hypothetical protein KUTeg_017994 [Tegillarca granosa]|uniref:Uncharacterized protein n=1 Tax=Tegillarca granosa TaxID=220873 RepID=A0ABQ9EJ17_TEGGR|nr:hypothetical protein KUTeg_017994 [Tegillarca granosa]
MALCLRRCNIGSMVVAKNRCELSCRARYYNFHSKFADKVKDGTFCGVNKEDDGVCINGECLN